jgi:multicomponent Na+:H+ antiporter subunit F
MIAPTVALYLVLPILTIALSLTFYRLARGPSLADRVVALDLMGTIGVALIGAYVVVTSASAFLDIALIIALISFLGTAAFAYYLERRA